MTRVEASPETFEINKPDSTGKRSASLGLVLGATMPYIPDFDTDAILSALDTISQKHPEGSPERDIIELAQIALIYPRHTRKEDDFRKFYRDFFDPSFKLKVSHEFATRDDADKWLASGKAEDAERVRIAGKGFMVVRLPGRFTFMSAPLEGEEVEANASEDDSE